MPLPSRYQTQHLYSYSQFSVILILSMLFLTLLRNNIESNYFNINNFDSTWLSISGQLKPWNPIFSLEEVLRPAGFFEILPEFLAPCRNPAASDMPLRSRSRKPSVQVVALAADSVYPSKQKELNNILHIFFSINATKSTKEGRLMDFMILLCLWPFHLKAKF